MILTIAIAINIFISFFIEDEGTPVYYVSLAEKEFSTSVLVRVIQVIRLPVKKPRDKFFIHT